jgi:2-dehydro-3-deoxyphosphogluconate aldolase / (4S)-4-hydroxy-2-oxoglutarate aldolase
MDVADMIGAARIVPVIRTAHQKDAITAIRIILDSGLGLVEIAATTPGWLTALQEARAEYPDAVVGVGSIVDPIGARQALDHGADFLVCPYLSSEVRGEASAALIEGGMTPGEIASAARHGMAKLFPAHTLGPAYLKSLLAVMPGTKIMPTGGITPDSVAAWFDAGAHAVGIGSAVSDPHDLVKSIKHILDQI